MMRSSSTIWRGGNRCGVPLFERGRWRRVSEPREAARNRRLRALHGSPAEQATIDRGRAEDRRVPKPDRVLAPHRVLPILRKLGVREVARRTGHSTGAVHAVLQGDATPRTIALDRYCRVAHAWALESGVSAQDISAD